MRFAYSTNSFSRLLGRWEAAYLDLQTSLKLDFDENVQETVKELEPIVCCVR